MELGIVMILLGIAGLVFFLWYNVRTGNRNEDPIVGLDLNPGIEKKLVAAGYKTVSQLKSASDDDLRVIGGMDDTAVIEVREALREYDFQQLPVAELWSEDIATDRLPKSVQDHLIVVSEVVTIGDAIKVANGKLKVPLLGPARQEQIKESVEARRRKYADDHQIQVSAVKESWLRRQTSKRLRQLNLNRFNPLGSMKGGAQNALGVIAYAIYFLTHGVVGALVFILVIGLFCGGVYQVIKGVDALLNSLPVARDEPVNPQQQAALATQAALPTSTSAPTATQYPSSTPTPLVSATPMPATQMFIAARDLVDFWDRTGSFSPEAQAFFWHFR